jgi:hypothetical protein
LANWQPPDWDGVIVENIQRIRSEQSLTIEEIAWNLYQATAEQWTENRVYRLLGRDRGRHFKWTEVVAIAEAFGTTIFDLVLPADETDAAFSQLSRDFGMHPVDLVASQRDTTRRDARMRDNTWWALQYHPRVKSIWELGRSEAQEIVARDEIGADQVTEDTRSRAAAETRRIFFRAWKERFNSDTLQNMTNRQIDKEGPSKEDIQETMLKILAELGMLDKTEDS